ncbi:MAG TPA: TetR/AcrR family transcriptional regulator [Sporosarcina sp.]|nr:TetR/AcrR family transcriptional regulator [Sporosarcina sp.]
MREKIMRKSIQLFEEKGFSQTSISDIVNSLDVTKGTFYYYFHSKEEILMDIHQQYINHMLKRQAELIEQTSLSNQEKLIEMMTILIDDIRDKGSSGRVFFRELRHLNEDNSQQVKEKRKAFRLNIEKIIQDGIDAGEFKPDLRADMIAFGVLGVTNYSYNWFQPDGEVTSKQLAHLFADMVLHGIVYE